MNGGQIFWAIVFGFFAIISPLLTLLCLVNGSEIPFIFVFITAVELFFILSETGKDGIKEMKLEDEEKEQKYKRGIYIFTVVFLIEVLIVLIPYYE